MTCIVAYKDKDKIWMGGDSLGTDDYMNKTVRKDEKVFIKNDMIFGFCGSIRMGQIIRYSLNIPPRSEDSTDMEYLVGQFIPTLIECYENTGFLQKSEGAEYKGGQFLIGYRGNIYDVQSDFQIGIPSLNYESIGGGDNLARGAMFILQHDKKLSPDKKLKLALDAASEHSASVAPPYIILNI